MAGNHATSAAHGHGHDHGGHGGHSSGHHASAGTYVTGFILAIILTVIPFYLVMKQGTLSHEATLAAILILAAVQVVVHLIYFLHLSMAPEQRWNLIAFAFTVLVVGILVGGSVWIMFNISDNMMPSMSMPMEG